MVEIETYKGVKIFFDKQTSRLKFNFEGRREVKYLFEAHQIIDEPNWEVCDLKGFFIDGTFNDYIGLAKAEKRDIKSGRPLWLTKGRFDMQYKKPNDWEKTEVYPNTAYNQEVYKKWEAQAKVVRSEEKKLKAIIKELSKEKQ